MEIITIALLAWTNSVAISGYIEIFMPQIGIDIESIVLALFISLLGILLGFILYHYLKRNINHILLLEQWEQFYYFFFFHIY